jgi:hypothetical protein
MAMVVRVDAVDVPVSGATIDSVVANSDGRAAFMLFPPNSGGSDHKQREQCSIRPNKANGTLVLRQTASAEASWTTIPLLRVQFTTMDCKIPGVPHQARRQPPLPKTLLCSML